MASRTLKNKCLLFKPLSLQYLVLAAIAKSGGPLRYKDDPCWPEPFTSRKFSLARSRGGSQRALKSEGRSHQRGIGCEEPAATSDGVSCCSVTKSCPTLCDPRACSTPGSVLHISWSLFKLMSIEWMMLSNHLILSPPSPPAFNLSQHQSFLMSQLFPSGGQSIGI